MADLRIIFVRIKGFARTLHQRDIVTHAASGAFYTFLSLFPLTALAASLIPCVGISQAALFHMLDGFVPSGVSVLLQAILSNVYQNVFPALPVSLLVLLWSAARSFSELLRGMAAMAGDPAVRYLRRHLRAILLTVALLLTLLLSFSLLIFGVRIAVSMERMAPKAVVGTWALVLRLRYIGMAALLWLLFVFLFRSIPNCSFTFREVRLAAALSAAAWILFSALFSLYASHLLDLSLYGSMATMVVTMLWLFYCQYILLIGAGICAYTQKKAEADTN